MIGKPLPEDDSPMAEVEDSLVAHHGQEYANLCMFSSNQLEIGAGLLRCAKNMDNDPELVKTQLVMLAQVLIMCTAKLGKDYCDEHKKDKHAFEKDISAFSKAGHSEMDEMQRRTKQ